MMKKYIALILFYSISQAATAIDWSAIEGKDVVLFHPGQASWEWALTQSSHSAAKKFRGGKNCADCHDGEQAEIGALIASGEKLEPDPVKGADGSTSVNIKMARDDSIFYVQLAWKASTAPQRAPMDPDHEVMVTMMLGDDSVKEAPRAGCWGTCHSDLPDMVNAAEGDKLSKYLGASRTKMTRQGGGSNFKTEAEFQALISAGKYLEYWQTKLLKGTPAKVVDGYILDKRHKSETPAVAAEAGFNSGVWTVVLSRKLQIGEAQHKDLTAGSIYTVGFALHSGHTEGRFHHVSLEYSLSLDGGEADFVVVKQ